MSTRTTYRIPSVLAIVTVFGLLFALLGDGLWDGVSWALLSLPLIVCVRFILRSPLRK
jgi:uncharacterized membrane protein YjjP (DUF1212 family)